jgi:hypothetical protein
MGRQLSGMLANNAMGYFIIARHGFTDVFIPWLIKGSAA